MPLTKVEVEEKAPAPKTSQADSRKQESSARVFLTQDKPKVVRSTTDQFAK
jgi:hypothetical protein